MGPILFYNIRVLVNGGNRDYPPQKSPARCQAVYSAKCQLRSLTSVPIGSAGATGLLSYPSRPIGTQPPHGDSICVKSTLSKRPYS